MLSFIPQIVWDNQHLMAAAAARQCLEGEPALYLHKSITLLHFADVISGALGRKGQVSDYTMGQSRCTSRTTVSPGLCQVCLSQGLDHQVVTECLLFARYQQKSGLPRSKAIHLTKQQDGRKAFNSKWSAESQKMCFIKSHCLIFVRDVNPGSTDVPDYWILYPESHFRVFLHAFLL